MTRFTALLLPLLLCTATAHAAELTASVDRSRLNSGETVELTLETSDVTQFGKPDLTALEALFEVRGTRAGQPAQHPQWRQPRGPRAGSSPCCRKRTAAW
jgi:hypothetical protein